MLDIEAHKLTVSKRFFALGAEDEQRLRDLNGLAESYANDVIEKLYDHLLRPMFLVAGRVMVRTPADVVRARQEGRSVAEQAGFSPGDQALIATAISELARNIVTHAESGEILVHIERRGGRRGVVVVARDSGPGISDIQAAMRDGYSTTQGMGMGLSSTRRLMDEFTIHSEPAKGTTVIATKWGGECEV